MARFVALVLVLAVVASGAAAPVALGAQAPAATGTADDTGGEGKTDLVTLTIKVRTNTGDPLGNVQVEVSHGQGTNETKTFSNGNALVDVPRGADVTIRVTSEDYIRNHPVTVNSVGRNDEVVVTMYPKAVAQVNVEDENGPVNGAKVTLRKENGDRVVAEGRTGSDGLYQSPEIEAGTYVATVVKTGYRQVTTEMGVSGVSATTVTLEEATVPVTVKVRDDHFQTAEPVQGATVSVVFDGETIKQAKTGEKGNTQLSVGVNGQYTIRVTKNGYEVSERTFYLGEEGTSFTFQINRERSLSLSAVNNRVLVGETVLVRVKNAYGEPVEGATVSRNGTEVSTTDASGELRVPIPDQGTFEVVATKEGVRSDGVIVQGKQAATSDPTTTTTTTPSPTTTEATTTEGSEPILGLPGFGAGVAVAGVLAGLAALAVRGRRRS